MFWAGELCPIVHLLRLWDKEENEKESEEEFDKVGNVRVSVSTGSLPNWIHLFMFAFLSSDTVNSTYSPWLLLTPWHFTNFIIYFLKKVLKSFFTAMFLLTIIISSALDSDRKEEKKSWQNSSQVKFPHKGWPMLLSSVRILTSWEAPWHDIQVDEQPNYQQAEPGADSSTEKFGREDPS